MNIADYFEGELKAGQADVNGIRGSNFARVEHDGATYFYDLPHDTSLEAFQIAAEVAFEMDADDAGIWGRDGYALVRFQ